MPLPLPRRPAWPGWALLGLWSVLLAGCGRARMQPLGPVTSRLDPVVHVLELPYTTQAAAALAPPSWYANLVVVLDDLPAEPERLKELLEQRRGSAYQAGAALLKEILDQTGRARGTNELWGLFSLEMGARVPERGGAIQLHYEAGLEKLYARRAQLAFENVLLETALLRLTTAAGLKYAQQRAHNPLVNYRRQDVTILEALQDLLRAHNFEFRLTGSSVQATLNLRDFASRQDFIQAVTESILAAGRQLERGIPALIVRPLDKPSTPPAAPPPVAPVPEP